MNNNTKYLFEWSEPNYASDAKIISSKGDLDNFVCEDNGFGDDMMQAILGLEMNEVWEFHGLRVKRLQGVEIASDDTLFINEELVDKAAQEVLLGND